MRSDVAPKILKKSQLFLDVGSGFKNQDFFEETFQAETSLFFGGVISGPSKETPIQNQGGKKSAKQTQLVGLWVLGRCEQQENPTINVNFLSTVGIELSF